MQQQIAMGERRQAPVNRVRWRLAVLLEDLPALLLGLVFPLLLAALSWRTFADPDLPGHLLFGKYTLQHHALLTLDPYSFTSDRAWVNHEWLGEVMMAASYLCGGTLGLLFLRSMTAVVSLIVVAYAVRRAGVRRPLRLALTLIAAIGVFSQVTAVRPQLFSLLLFSILLAVLMRLEGTDGRRGCWVGAIFGVWANVHGGWLVGLGTVGLWAVGCFKRRLNWKRSSLVLFAAAGGTLLTPYGLELWRFMSDTVGLGRADIEDWQPLFKFPSRLLPWGLGAVVMVAACRRLGRNERWRLLPVAALAILSLKVVRVDAFFVLASVVLLAPGFSDWGPTRFPLSRPPDRAQKLLVAAVVAAITALAMGYSAAMARCVPFENGSLRRPWAPEPEAVVFFQSNGIRGRLLTWFDYGQYAIWHLSPDIKVSFDGRRETVYSERVLRDHARFYLKGDASYAEALRADYAWLPNWLPAVNALERNGWAVAFRGTRSTILARHPGGEFTMPPNFVGSRCFPGP